MPFIKINGIETKYAVVGSGPPLLMFAPGGFDARIEKWSELGQYAKIMLLDQLPDHFTCILFDRRENGESGGRIERITGRHFVDQAKGLIDHLRIRRAHLLGGCLGCSWAAAFAATYPHAVESLILHWPVGGPKYRLTSELRFAQHLTFIRRHGLAGLVELARAAESSFAADPRLGPWASVIPRDETLAKRLLAMDQDRYEALVSGIGRSLFGRETIPGVDLDELLALDVPALIIAGDDDSHARSAAHLLHEALRGSELCDDPAEQQSQAIVTEAILSFVNRNAAAPSSAVARRLM
jgi:pimeloyl-ACP methyl ester carboxylesterase